MKSFSPAWLSASFLRKIFFVATSLALVKPVALAVMICPAGSAICEPSLVWALPMSAL